ncbi:hypothetical protein GCM10008933_34930 [Paenibacillus motobuensis]|uniref:Uncharacterized protein n=1 Tax=Paenibacillus motobuensis TaxID=295324 RepID=A0ABP3IG19_9BACL
MDPCRTDNRVSNIRERTMIYEETHTYYFVDLDDRCCCCAKCIKYGIDS